MPIWIGTYLDWIESEEPLASLTTVLERIGASGLGVHALPFLDNPHVDRFALTQLARPRHGLGTLPDLDRFLSRQPTMIDLILGHVGASTVGSGNELDPLLNAALVSATLGALAGRASHLQVATDSGSRKYLQTFGPEFIDVDLASRGGWEMATKIIEFISERKAGAVRLDAAAYYQKSLGNGEPHQPGNKALVEKVSEACRASLEGVQVLGQFDCDSVGQQYLGGSQCDLVYDYSFSAISTHAMLSGETLALAEHINRTREIAPRLLRAPRTHDGIYLFSPLMPREVVRWFEAWGAQNAAEIGPVRREGSLYEVNLILPEAAVQISGDSAEAAWRVCSLMAIALASRSVAYAYLPTLLMQIPTQSPSERDPRSRNRLGVSQTEAMSLVAKSQQVGAIRSLLDLDGQLRETVMDDWTASVPRQGILQIGGKTGRVVANLSMSEFWVGTQVVSAGRFLWLPA